PTAPLAPARTRMPTWGWPLVAGSVLFGSTALTLAVVQHVRQPPEVRVATSPVPAVSPPGLSTPGPEASSAQATLPGGVSGLTLVPSGLLARLAMPSDAQELSAVSLASRDERKAWRTLAEAWGLSPDALTRADVCAAGGLPAPLQCMRSSGGL